MDNKYEVIRGDKYEVIRCDRCGEKLRDLNDVTCATSPCYHVKINWRDYIICESCRNELDLFMVNPNYHPHLPPANKFCGYPPPVIKDFDESVFDDEPEADEKIEVTFFPFKNSVVDQEIENGVDFKPQIEYIVIDCATGKVKGAFEERALANDLAIQLNNENGGYGFFVLCVDYNPQNRE